MVDALSDQLPDYTGRAGHTQCFLRTTNLITKSLLHGFDVKQGVQGTNKELTLDKLYLLREMDKLDAVDPDDNDTSAIDDSDLETNEDNLEGWVHEVEKMSVEEWQRTRESIRLVQLALTKIHKLAFKIINSSTNLLPER
ncbi:hypothetical protein JVU11DRAFT_10599 [Chiua virens]|nr:hypothetical protein JVU11DRAFT_10599 [Chiua virens]